MDIQEKIAHAPASCGVYIFKDKDAKAIYIGKAVSIKARLKSHLSGPFANKQKALLENTADIDYILTSDEPAALLLEAALIKRYMPRYNVALRDDKSYPRLKLTVNEKYPRIFITRKLKDDGACYFGPYTDARLLRKAVSLMKRLFPLRTCAVLPKRALPAGRQACLNAHILQCIAPCIDKTKDAEYAAFVQEARLFLEGRSDELIDSLAAQMNDAAGKKDYEQAARIRDRIRALSLVSGRDEPSMGELSRIIADEKSISAAGQLEQLRQVVGAKKAPSIIEAFDVSNIFGKEATGSMVRFKDARPDKDQYRRFRIETVDGIDDYNMMREIVRRRYSYLLNTKKPMPDLIIIDGGKGHLIAARRQIQKLGILDVPIVAIAKNPDRLYIDERKEPLLLGNYQAALFLVQRIRDEAHRFAIGYHRLLRRRKMGVSELDDIEGIGKTRKAQLIRYFGSLDEIRSAKIEELMRVESINEKEAKAIYNHFRS